jgi:hypothetical protein
LWIGAYAVGVFLLVLAFQLNSKREARLRSNASALIVASSCVSTVIDELRAHVFFSNINHRLLLRGKIA